MLVKQSRGVETTALVPCLRLGSFLPGFFQSSCSDSRHVHTQRLPCSQGYTWACTRTGTRRGRNSPRCGRICADTSRAEPTGASFFLQVFRPSSCSTIDTHSSFLVSSASFPRRVGRGRGCKVQGARWPMTHCQSCLGGGDGVPCAQASGFRKMPRA